MMQMGGGCGGCGGNNNAEIMFQLYQILFHITSTTAPTTATWPYYGTTAAPTTAATTAAYYNYT